MNKIIEIFNEDKYLEIPLNNGDNLLLVSFPRYSNVCFKTVDKYSELQYTLDGKTRIPFETTEDYKYLGNYYVSRNEIDFENSVKSEWVKNLENNKFENYSKDFPRLKYFDTLNKSFLSLLYHSIKDQFQYYRNPFGFSNMLYRYWFAGDDTAWIEAENQTKPKMFAVLLLEK